jgi:YcaO-like protein with predicted kinase domain
MDHRILQGAAFIEALHTLDATNECPFHIAAAVLEPDRWGRKRVTSGRGLTKEEAQERCIAEAIERHSAVFDPDIALTRAAPAELGHEAVDPASLLLISERQYSCAEHWNRSVSVDQHLPQTLDLSKAIAWVKPLQGPLLPAACCFLGYPDALHDGFPVPDSSGLAAGQTAADAEERALLELVERDAVSIWWYGRVHRPAIKLQHSQIPMLECFEQWVARSRRRFWLLDLTHDLGIPVVAAVMCNRAARDISLGFGAGLTAEAAAEAAIGELVQFDVSKRLQAQNQASPKPGLVAWCMSADITSNSFLCPEEKATQVTPAAGPVKQRLLDRGLKIHFIHMPSLVTGIRVVRAFVPGLRPIWPRFAPGRLYDIPQNLGWTVKKITELALNPVPILY